MSKKPKRSQTPNGRREAEMDFEDFMELRGASSKKQPSKKRKSRSSRKSDLRDAALDPDALDEYMDEFER